jgi:hypothetical protein
MSGGMGRRARVGFVIDALEKRRLLAGLTFGSPVSTELPAGFVPDRILAAAYLGINGRNSAERK